MLPRRSKAAFEPRREFVNQARESFLFEYRKAVPVRSPRLNLAFRTLIGLLVATAAVGGTAVYADVTNVSPSQSVLYPLKRYAEVIRATVTPASEQPALHLGFAGRRLEEIEELTKTTSTEPTKAEIKIQGLVDDLNDEVETSVAANDGNKEEEDKRVVSACEFLNRASINASSVVEDAIMKGHRGFMKFSHERCAGFALSVGQAVASNENEASSSVTEGAAAAGNASSTPHSIRSRGGEENEFELEQGKTEESSTLLHDD